MTTTPAKEIKYYRKTQYGVDREFVVDGPDAVLIQSLTKQKTITPEIRNVITALAGGGVRFLEIFAPR